MMLNDGCYAGRRILSQETIRLFTGSPLAERKIWRGLGFDKRDPASSPLGGTDSYGHTGFTGTIFWIDARAGLYMVFLSNGRMPDTGRQQTAFDLSANQDMGGRKAGLSLRFVLIDHFSPDEFPDFFAASPAAVSCDNDSPHVSSALPKHYHPCSDRYRPERTAAETSRTRQPVPPTNSSPKRFSRTTQINKKNRLHALHATCLKNIPEKRPTGSSLRAALRWNGSTPCAS